MLVLIFLLLIDWTNPFILLFLFSMFLRFNSHVLDDQEVLKYYF